jgi:hypothetical protein
MVARVQENGQTSEPFNVSNGTKQGCVLAPLLFNIFFAMMLYVAFKDCSKGIPIEFRTDCDPFNTRRLQARTKTLKEVVRELLYADDCALTSHTLEEAQELLDLFSSSAKRFGLTISLKKTEVMHQSSPVTNQSNASLTCEGQVLQCAENFCYLGSVLNRNVSLEKEIESRLGKASAAFGSLRSRLWNDHGIRLDTKLAVYRAVFLTTLLYGSETWTVYRYQIKKLDRLHMQCLRQIAHIKWQDKTPNTEVLDRCHSVGIEAMIIANQLRWSGHVARMEDRRAPKCIFYGQLASGTRSVGAPLKRYKDQLKSNLKKCGFTDKEFGTVSLNRDEWRQRCRQGCRNFEEARVDELKLKRGRRKGTAPLLSFTAATTFKCDICGRLCQSRIGLLSHTKAHRRN